VTKRELTMIMVDFEARMETVLKEMHKLLRHLDLESGMDLSKFLKVPGTMFMATRVDPSLVKDVALQIDVSDEEEYETRSESDEEESPPPIQSNPSHKMKTQIAKLTLSKTTTKALGSQGGSSTKKVQKRSR